MLHCSIAVAGIGQFAGRQMLNQGCLFSRNAAAAHATVSSLQSVVCKCLKHDDAVVSVCCSLLLCTRFGGKTVL
jgi:hypothetical protein